MMSFTDCLNWVNFSEFEGVAQLHQNDAQTLACLELIENLPLYMQLMCLLMSYWGHWGLSAVVAQYVKSHRYPFWEKLPVTGVTW